MRAGRSGVLAADRGGEPLPDDVARRGLRDRRGDTARAADQNHAVVITERFAAFGEPGNPAPVGARCVCGESWRWTGKDDDDPLASFPAWAAQHEGES